MAMIYDVAAEEWTGTLPEGCRWVSVQCSQDGDRWKGSGIIHQGEKCFVWLKRVLNAGKGLKYRYYRVVVAADPDPNGLGDSNDDADEERTTKQEVPMAQAKKAEKEVKKVAGKADKKPVEKEKKASEKKGEVAKVAENKVNPPKEKKAAEKKEPVEKKKKTLETLFQAGSRRDVALKLFLDGKAHTIEDVGKKLDRPRDIVQFLTVLGRTSGMFAIIASPDGTFTLKRRGAAGAVAEVESGKKAKKDVGKPVKKAKKDEEEEPEEGNEPEDEDGEEGDEPDSDSDEDDSDEDAGEPEEEEEEEEVSMKPAKKAGKKAKK